MYMAVGCTTTARDLSTLELEVALGQVHRGAEQAEQTDQIADGEVSDDCVHFAGVSGSFWRTIFGGRFRRTISKD